MTNRGWRTGAGDRCGCLSSYHSTATTIRVDSRVAAAIREQVSFARPEATAEDTRGERERRIHGSVGPVVRW
jgi:hypothetical protein